jgi:hypothetical protein
MKVLLALALAVAVPAGAQTILKVEGAPKPLSLDAAALWAMPRAAATQSFDGKPVRCEGVWLTDVLAAAGTPAGEQLRGAAQRTVVVAIASDGYRVAFTLGELDRAFGKGKVLVADRCEGAPLAGAGPLRIVVEGDARGGRALRNLTTLRLVELP